MGNSSGLVPPVGSVRDVVDVILDLPGNVGQEPVLGSDAFDPLNGVNVDQWRLSLADKQKIQFSRIQFGLSYQVMNAMNAWQGPETSLQNLFPPSSFDFLQGIAGQFQNTLSAVPTEAVPDTASPSPSPSPSQDEALPEEVLTTIKKAQNVLERLEGFFSPEETAMRILEVADSFFRNRGAAWDQGGDEAARQAFSDGIMEAIDLGFRQARQHLWELPHDVQNGVDQTHALVMEGLAKFIREGSPVDSTNWGATMSIIAAYHQEASQIFTQARTIFAPSEYDTHGRIQPISMATFSKIG